MKSNIHLDPCKSDSGAIHDGDDIGALRDERAALNLEFLHPRLNRTNSDDAGSEPVALDPL